MGQFILNEGVAPSTPAAGYVSIYAKTDGKIYSKDDAGVETVITHDAALYALLAGSAAQTFSVAPATASAHAMRLDQTVDLTTNQTIAGIKTFSGQLIGKGTTTNDSAAAGMIGEAVESILVSGSAVALTTNVTANITSISLTAGDWIVYGNCGLLSGGATSVQMMRGGASSTSVSLGSENAGGFSDNNGIIINSAGLGYSPFTYPEARFKLAATTTIYLVGYALFSVASLSMFGRLTARRIR